MLFVIIFFALLSSSAIAENTAPWGVAKPPTQTYQAQKVLFDVDTGDKNALINILDRISLLNKLYNADPFDSRITIILHGESIPYFSIQNLKANKDFIKRVQQFSLQETIKFKLCAAAAKARYKLEPTDFHGFIEMVPMADAEIVRLQKEEGFAYMRWSFDLIENINHHRGTKNTEKNISNAVFSVPSR